MLSWLAIYLQQYASGFQVFQYLTLRAIMATLTALIISLVFGPKLISWLTRLQVGQTVRDDGPQSHLVKTGTPTMGGMLILLSITASTLLWADLTNRYIWVVLLITIAFGGIGFVDDYRKLVLKDTRGLPARYKLLWQCLFALFVGCFLYFTAIYPSETQLVVPFFKNITIYLGWFFPILVLFVVVGTSNAVNLTDGLDGLAIMPTVMVAGALGIFAYATGNAS